MTLFWNIVISSFAFWRVRLSKYAIIVSKYAKFEQFDTKNVVNLKNMFTFVRKT